jgi:hypothetical protein
MLLTACRALRFKGLPPFERRVAGQRGSKCRPDSKEKKKKTHLKCGGVNTVWTAYFTFFFKKKYFVFIFIF